MEPTLSGNIRAIFSRYRFRFLKASLTVLAANSLFILNPLIFRQAVIAQDPSSGVAEGFMAAFLQRLLGPFWPSLWPWPLMLGAVALCSALFKYRMRLLFIEISREVERDLRGKLFSRIQEQSRAFFDRYPVGELLSRLTNDVAVYRDLLGPGIMYPLFFLTLIIPGLAALFYISPYLACLSLLPIFLIPLLNRAVRHAIYSLSTAAQEGLGEMSTMAQEHYSASRIVKSYTAEERLSRRFYSLGRRLIGVNRRLYTLQGLLYPFFALITRLMTVALVLFTAALMLKGWSDLSTADFVSFMWIQSYLYVPIIMLGWVLPIYQRGRAAYERLAKLYGEPVEVVESAKEPLAIPEKAAIAFKHLTFTYPLAGEPALNDLNLEIKGGSFVGITGPVGGGKSTLFRLLMREYALPRSMIEIGGRDIHDYPLASFREAMVSVEQIPFLFSKTIAENVQFGKEEAGREELERVLKHADLYETVMEFPEQYETLVGERGVTLSGGEKQRVAMARAFLVNRSILLLDDIFAHLDAATERRIFEAVSQNYRGKTLLLITHRASILEKMDRIISLAEGRVVEDGPPERLFKKGGYFATLKKLQELA